MTGPMILTTAYWFGLALSSASSVVRYVAQVGVDVDLADPDPGGLLEVVARGAAAAVEADVAVDGVADALQHFEVELFGDRVAAVQVADRGGVSVDPGLGYERRGTLGGGEGLADLVVVDGLGVDVGSPAEVVRLGLDERARRPLGVIDDLPGGRDDVGLGGVAVGLAVVDVDELKARVDARLGRFDTGTVSRWNSELRCGLPPVVIFVCFAGRSPASPAW
jgi:hypothetical protein